MKVILSWILQRLSGGSDAVTSFGVCYHMTDAILDNVVNARVRSWGNRDKIRCNNPVYNEQILWPRWMQFPSQDKVLCGEHSQINSGSS